VFIQPPPGPGWRVADSHRERYTVWTRRQAVTLPYRWERRP
jgi:hypothetical protein